MKSVICPIQDLDTARRWDFGFFDPAYKQTMQLLDTAYRAVTLDSIVTQLSDMGAFSLYNVKFFVESGVPFLRVQNVQEYGIDLDKDTKYITKEYHEQLTKSQLCANDLLLTTKAIIGVAAVMPDDLGECNISQNLVRIRLVDEVNPRYVAVFLNSRFGRLQSETAATGPSQKYLNFKRIRALRIPLPPRPVQDRIAQIMQDAYTQRRTMLTKADQAFTYAGGLLQSAFKLPLDHLVDQKHFTTSIRSLRSGRFDLDLHNTRYTGLMAALAERFGEDIRALDQVCMPITSGATPLGSNYVNEGILFLRVQNISSDGTLDLNERIYVTESFARSISRSALQHGDVVLTIVGATIGKSAVVRELNEPAVPNQAIARLRVRDVSTIDPDYLQIFLSSEVGRIQINALKRPVAQGNLNLTETGRIKVPVIAIAEQKSIVDAVMNLRAEAKRLRADAERVVAEAKAHVERMILGEEA